MMKLQAVAMCGGRCMLDDGVPNMCLCTQETVRDLSDEPLAHSDRFLSVKFQTNSVSILASGTYDFRKTLSAALYRDMEPSVKMVASSLVADLPSAIFFHVLHFLPESICCSLAQVSRAHRQLLALTSASRYWQQRPFLAPAFVAALLDSPVILPRFVLVRSLTLATRRPLTLDRLWALVELFPSITSLDIPSEVDFVAELEEVDSNFLTAFPHLTSFSLDFPGIGEKAFPLFTSCIEALAASRALTRLSIDNADGLSLMVHFQKRPLTL